MNELTYCIISSICSTLALVLLGLVGKIQPSLCHEKNISFLHIKIFVSGYGIWKVWNSQTPQIPYEYYAIFTQLQYYLTSMSNAKLDIFGILFPCIYPLFRKSVLEIMKWKKLNSDMWIIRLTGEWSTKHINNNKSNDVEEKSNSNYFDWNIVVFFHSRLLCFFAASFVLAPLFLFLASCIILRTLSSYPFFIVIH